MINWKQAKKEQPKDKQKCWITTECSGNIIGPLPYIESQRWFMNFGAVYTVDSEDYNLYWCAAEEINVPEEE
jgi:hypothetical protein